MADDTEQAREADATSARIHQFAVRVVRICGRASSSEPSLEPPPERES
jgi:hypothetical protein